MSLDRHRVPVYNPGAVKLSQVVGDYVRHLAAYKGYSLRTCECYDLTYRQFIAYLLGRGLTDDVRQFTDDHAEGFARYLAENGLRPNSILTKLAGLSSLARYLTRTKDAKGRPLLDHNPVERFDRPQKQRVDRPFLHRDELKAVAQVGGLTTSEALARDLFIDTGLRVSELARASAGDAWKDGEGRTVLSVTVKGRGRAEERVHISLAPEIGCRIEDYLLARNLPEPQEPLLLNREGKRYTRNTLSEMIARLGRRAGVTRVPVRPHTIRHTYNVVARSAGIDALTRSKLLNHSDPSTVARYDHLLPEETAAARERVREALR